ncbi:MAG: hypothetical protein COA78_00275 [Blastopirellula sp.]|nr:MAG: hypothetical protein COA78_00275 [Blastopirellula sp.]
MPAFKTVSDDDPILPTSPLIRGVLKTAEYIKANGGIGLTKSGAFNRKFVHWAAAEFDWPGYSKKDLFSINKVLNEWDFPPVGDIHDLLKGLKLGRHYKGKFLLTNAGKELMAHPGRLLSEVVLNYLFRLDHGAHLRPEDQILGNWDVFLNVINVEAEYGTSRSALRKVLYGDPDSDPTHYDSTASVLYVTVLRPLCWAGLLEEQEPHRLLSDGWFVKTELWRRILRLDTDRHIKPRMVH